MTHADLAVIAEALARASARDLGVVLVAAVRVGGGACAGPRQVVAEDGATAGTLGDPALERAAACSAGQAGTTRLVRADGSTGPAELLVEPLSGDRLARAFFLFGRQLPALGPAVLVTVVRVAGADIPRVGDRAVVTATGLSPAGEIPLVPAIIHDARQALRSGRSALRSYPWLSGEVEMWLEVVGEPGPADPAGEVLHALAR